jgi:hypothetical protein
MRLSPIVTNRKKLPQHGFESQIRVRALCPYSLDKHTRKSHPADPPPPPL